MKRYLLAGCRNVKLLLILYRCYSESAAEPGFACFIRQMVRAGVPSPSSCPSLLIKGVIYNLFTCHLLHITKVWGNSSVTMINLWSLSICWMSFCTTVADLRVVKEEAVALPVKSVPICRWFKVKVTLLIPVGKFTLQKNDSIWHPFRWNVGLPGAACAHAPSI